jgi:PAS domain S-box-containing protein
MKKDKSSEEYLLLFWNNPLPMWIYDIKTLKFLDVNVAAVERYGYSREEFLAMTIKEIRPAEDIPALLQNLSREPKKVERSGGVWKHKKKDGSIIYVEIASHEIIFQGTKARFVSIIEITDSKKSLDALGIVESRFHALVENSLVGIYIIQNDRFSYVNPKFAEIFGYSQQEIISSKTVSDLVAPNYRHRVNENIRKRLSGEVQSLRYRFRGVRKDNGIVYIEVHGSRTDVAGKPAVLGTLVDITDSVRSEKELKYRRGLEKLIEDVSANFINLESEEVDHSIIESLKSVCKFFRVDMSYVFLYDSQDKIFRSKYGWAVDDKNQTMSKFDFIDATAFPWGVEKIINFEHVNISKVPKMPPEAELEKQLLSSIGVKSLLAVPLVYKKNLEGLLGVNTNSGEKIWRDDDIWFLKMLGEVFINAIVHKRMHDALQDSETKYRRLNESMTDAFVVANMEGLILEFNGAYKNMLGYDDKELRALTLLELTPEKWHSMESIIVEEQILKRGYSDVYEMEYIKKDGTIIPVELRTFVITDGRGKNVAMWAIVRDISERKRTQEALVESEEKWRSLVQNAPDYITLVDREGKIKFINFSISGRSPEEIIGSSLYEYIATPFQKDVHADIQYVFETGEPRLSETVTYLAGNETIWLENHMGPVRKNGKVVEVLIISNDITIKKQALGQLQKSEERFRSLVHNSFDVITIHDADWFFRYATPSAERILGYKPEDLIGKNPLENVHPDDLPYVLEALNSVIKRSNPGTPTEYRYKLADGTWKYLESVALNLLDHPTINGVILTTRDITERKSAQKALFESEQKYRSLVETTGTGFVIVDESGRVEDANDEYVRLTGYKSLDEIIGRNVTEWTAEYDQIRNATEVKKCFEKGFVRNLQIDYVDQQGNVTPIEINANVLQLSSGKKIHTLCRDITERKQISNALKENERRLTALLNAATEPIALLNLDGIILTANATMAERMGLQIDEIIGVNAYSIMPPALAQAPKSKIEEVIRTGEAIRFEDSRGGWIYDNNIYPVQDKDGKVTGVAVFSVDITDQKHAEVALRESEEKFRNLAEQSPNMIFINQNGKILYANKKCEEIMGYGVDELTSSSFDFHNLISTKSMKAIEKSFSKHSRGEEVPSYEYLLLTKEGKNIEAIITTKLIKYSTGTAILGIVTDISELKRKETAVKESEARLRQVIDLVPHFIFAKNRKGQFILVNKAVADAYGTSVDNLLGKTDADFNPDPLEVEHFLKYDNEVIDSGQPRFIPEEKITDSAGKIRFLHTIKIPFYITTTSEDAVLGVSTNITERKLATEALRESEERYRKLAEAAHDMIFIIDRDGYVRYVNSFAAEQFNTVAEELIGRKREEIFKNDSSEHQEMNLKKVIQTGTPLYIEDETLFSSKNLWLGTWLVPLKDETNKTYAVLGVSRDITEQRSADEKLASTNMKLQEQIKELEESKKEISELLKEVTAKRDENADLLDIVKKRQQQLENLTKELIVIEELERKRFSQELHDSLGQILTTLKINLDLAISTSDNLNIDSQKYLQECEQLTETAMSEAKQLSYALRPSVLDDFGLTAALKMLVTQNRKLVNIPIELDLDIGDVRYDSIIETVIYRIVQEALTNIAKHAKATKAWVQLIRRDNILALSIIDNGIGFYKDGSQNTQELHFGLRNIRERVEFLGGKLYIESSIGKGTEVMVEINIQK